MRFLPGPEQIQKWGWAIAGIALFLGLWTFAAFRMANAVLLPEPAAVVQGLVTLLEDGTLISDVAASMKRVLGGFAIAAVLAVPLALLMAFSRPVGLLLSPIVTFLRPIPPIAWIPIAILWFGIGDPPSYFITALAAFFPIFINSYAGGHSVRPEHVHAARSLGAGPRALFVRIYLPSAMPMIATGLRIGLGQSWMAVVTAELIAAHSGLGYMIQANRLALETGLVLVGMCVIGVLGAVMSIGLEVLEKRVLVPWKHP
ncbi:ABC transporter permease [Aquabacter spiritensis]|uniref:NitT/TauT family transport system permease protein n=1 Tax=Aquabacter spiritensis TaxID=933073 RepID=A0A4R3M219_9HYPH|nr:ABC transporter permease [Aquabacter spiritensis]TCT05155.1 NitT/TauT family transport system permease protein [Aquabacter spiritensis]